MNLEGIDNLVLTKLKEFQVKPRNVRYHADLLEIVGFDNYKKVKNHLLSSESRYFSLREMINRKGAYRICIISRDVLNYLRNE